MEELARSLGSIHSGRGGCGVTSDVNGCRQSRLCCDGDREQLFQLVGHWLHGFEMLAEGGQPGVNMALAGMIFCRSVGQSSCAAHGSHSIAGRDVSVARCAEDVQPAPRGGEGPPAAPQPLLPAHVSPGHASRLLAAASSEGAEELCPHGRVPPLVRAGERRG